ncbi:hypothetical protein HELRODRAFT_158693 [Helobdella robusta]|uniref:SH3 domain-containing protein n=1 Tax=Helobdella robusta TaxID=6412 RepID=T1EN47_HELRO|nr:hypothetical protein HELRODRAFT_158693 [Helobdella robusta]ESO12224.1 hypothetical protein HELRODRAFT_158693 [Helobdella robusta]
MANKQASPLLNTQSQTTAVIKLVNKNIKPCLSELKKKIVDTDARKKLKEICLNELDKVYEQKKLIESLKEEDEPKQITKFNVKVAQELTKINNLEECEDDLILKITRDDENIETPEGGDRRSSTKLTSKSGKDTDNTGAEDEQPSASSSSDQGLSGKLMSNTLKSNADSEASKTDADKAKDGDDGNKYEDDNDDDDDEDEEEDEENEVKGSNLENRPPLVASRSETSSGKVGESKITEKAGRDAMLNQVKQSGVTDDHDERQDDVSKDDDDDDADEEETGMDQKELTTENVDEVKKRINGCMLSAPRLALSPAPKYRKRRFNLDFKSFQPWGRKVDQLEETLKYYNNIKATSCLYVALETFEGQEEGDLPFQKGDVLKIKTKRSDGWMLAVDEKGREGLVPANFLKSSAETGQRKIDDDRGNEEEIDEDEDDDDDDDKVGEIKSDEEVNDDEAYNDVENKGDGPKFKQINKSGNSLASQLKHSLAHMSKSEQRELIDRLSNVPSGYRLSTLAKFKSEEGSGFGGNLGRLLELGEFLCCVYASGVGLNSSKMKLR